MGGVIYKSQVMLCLIQVMSGRGHIQTTGDVVFNTGNRGGGGHIQTTGDVVFNTGNMGGEVIYKLQVMWCLIQVIRVGEVIHKLQVMWCLIQVIGVGEVVYKLQVRKYLL